MTTESWRPLFEQVTERVRAMGPGAAELMGELEVLRTRYEVEQKQAILEARQRLVDLDEIHNANRLGTLGTLTVGMAHEFGSPLGVVLARAQMIVTDAADLAEARNDAEQIIAQVKRMTQMCREVLDYARPKLAAKLPIDLVQVVRQMIALLVPDARKRNARLILAGDPPPCPVSGDESKLTQIFTNLVINAAQAMPRGGTVMVSVEKKRLAPPAVHGLPEADYVCVHVQDTGTGIRRADLAHVFETFFTTKREGTGLGLAVSYRIAREHDGWIGVVTEEGKGSTFTLYLPPIG